VATGVFCVPSGVLQRRISNYRYDGCRGFMRGSKGYPFFEERRREGAGLDVGWWWMMDDGVWNTEYESGLLADQLPNRWTTSGQPAHVGLEADFCHLVFFCPPFFAVIYFLALGL